MAYLREILTTGREVKHPLKFGVNQVGRLLNNQIIVKDSLVSRHHAEIIIDSQQTIIRDLRSRNNTYVNDREIKQKQLQEGDHLKFGNTVFIYSQQNIPQPKIPQFSRNYQPSVIKQFESFSLSNNEILKKIARSAPAGKSVVKIDLVDEQVSDNRAVEKLKLLLEVSQQLCSLQEPQIKLATILDLLFKAMDIDRAAILLLDEVSQELVCKVVKTKPEIKNDEPIYSSNIVNQVWETGKTLMAGDILENEDLKNAPSVIASSIHASICVPLTINDERLGVLYVDNLSMSLIYADEDVDFLSALASIASTAIHMANAYNKREENLKQQIQELQIQIDPERQAKESAEALEELDLARFQRVAKKFKSYKK